MLSNSCLIVYFLIMTIVVRYFFFVDIFVFVVKWLLLNVFNKGLIFIPEKIVQAKVENLLMLFVDSFIVFFCFIFAFIGILSFFVRLLAVYFRCLLIIGKVLAIYCSWSHPFLLCTFARAKIVQPPPFYYFQSRSLLLLRQFSSSI